MVSNEFRQTELSIQKTYTWMTPDDALCEETFIFKWVRLSFTGYEICIPGYNFMCEKRYIPSEYGI